MKYPVIAIALLVALISVAVAGACSDAATGTGFFPGGDAAFGDAGAGDAGAGDAATDGAPGDQGGADDVVTADIPAGDAASCTGCDAPSVCYEGKCIAPAQGGCTPGVVQGCASPTTASTCEATGTAYVPVECESSYGCVNGQCRPRLCAPKRSYCEGLAATKACSDDGTAFLAPEPCPGDQYCTSGKCTSTCISDPKFGAYVGCAYWTVDLPNWPDPTIFPTNPEDLPHALVISNPNELDAIITFEPPPGYVVNVPDPVVPGGESRTFEMPVINTDGSGIGHKGIRFESTRPILVHQFNPWKAIWSNDASLLLPEQFLGSDYVIMSWPTDPRKTVADIGIGGPNVNSFFTVVAPYDDTEVVIQVASRVLANGDIPAMEPKSLQTFTLNRGEILNIESDPTDFWDAILEGPHDLTGSTVSANKPVAVFAGHESAGIANPNAPATGPNGEENDSCCLDHLEEQMLPMHVLDSSYVAVKSKPRGSDPDIWRIQAAEANVTINTTPPQSGANGVTLVHRGDWLEVATEESFEIQATGKIQVGQYFIGGQATDSFTGDPSLMLAIPTTRFRKSYAITVPSGYDTNWISVVKPAGVNVVTSQGAINEPFQAIAGGTWERAYIELPVGVHTITGDEPFGLTAYGYNGAMSYGYSGGMSSEAP